MRKHVAKNLLITALALMCLLTACDEDETNPQLHTHEFGEWETVTEASCTVEGLRQRQCACGETEKQAVAVLGHHYQEETIVAPTCTAAGEKRFTCTCGSTYTEKISSLGHDYQNYEYNEDATCTADGTETGHCSRCEESHTRTALNTVLGHDYQNYEYNEDATCTADGTETGHCSRCEESHTRTALNTVLGHDYQNYEYNEDATCTADGTETGHCSRCEESHTRTALNTVLGHLFNDYVPNDDGTCIADGTQTSKCERCDATHTCTEVGSVKGHTYEDGICTVCSHEKITTSVGLEFALNEDGKGYTVTGIGSCEDKDIIIPRRYNGLPVTAIGEYAFLECGNINSVVIQKDLQTIGRGAFQLCYLMKSITIGESVRVIGDSAFENCGYLERVNIPAGVTKIGAGAFFFCSGLERADVEDLAGWCAISFDGLGANPLSYAKLYLNDEPVTVLTIPAQVEKVGAYAFSGCSGITTVIIEDGVTAVGDHAFVWCFDLTTVTLADSVTEIGTEAFLGSSKLRTVSLPEGLTAIESGAFQWCEKLSRIVFRGTQEQWEAVSKGENWDAGTGSYEVTFGEQSIEPELKLTVDEITFSQANGYSWDLYKLVVNKDDFDQALFTCISEDESLVRMDGTVAYGIGNAAGGVKVTLIYGQQQVTCLIRVIELEQENAAQTEE